MLHQFLAKYWKMHTRRLSIDRSQLKKIPIQKQQQKRTVILLELPFLPQCRWVDAHLLLLYFRVECRDLIGWDAVDGPFCYPMRWQHTW